MPKRGLDHTDNEADGLWSTEQPVDGWKDAVLQSRQQPTQSGSRRRNAPKRQPSPARDHDFLLGQGSQLASQLLFPDFVGEGRTDTVETKDKKK